MAVSAAFFDLDRTLISGASTFPLGIEAWRQDLAPNRDLLRWAFDAATFKLLGDTGHASDGVRNAFLDRIKGKPVGSLDGLANAVLPRLISRVRPEAKNLLEMHAGAGRDRWIVSASPDEIVTPLAEALQMTGAIGTRGEVADGFYTGNMEGPFVYGEGKAIALRSLAAQNGYDLERCYSYSDSISDLPMLDLVGHPVAVNPDNRLYDLARDRGWPVVIFSRKTKRAIAVTALGSAVATGGSLAYLLGRKHGKLATLAQLSYRRRLADRFLRSAR